jgi:hypothetical protein
MATGHEGMEKQNGLSFEGIAYCRKKQFRAMISGLVGSTLSEGIIGFNPY